MFKHLQSTLALVAVVLAGVKCALLRFVLAPGTNLRRKDVEAQITSDCFPTTALSCISPSAVATITAEPTTITGEAEGTTLTITTEEVATITGEVTTLTITTAMVTTITGGDTIAVISDCFPTTAASCLPSAK